VKVTIDVDRCTGHQMCAIAAPKVFGSDDFGNAIVLVENGDVPAELQTATRIAQSNCPERAIVLEEV
jgi:ferredoxin